MPARRRRGHRPDRPPRRPRRRDGSPSALARLDAPLTPGALADGTPIPLLANLGTADGAAEPWPLGAEGVGLFRTEFLFLDSATAPTVDEQQDEYDACCCASSRARRWSCVRSTPAPTSRWRSSTTPTEENPALGLRGLRALRAHEGSCATSSPRSPQADAATDADLWVMAPMVATVEETEYFMALARELGLKTAGVMIEVPSAALLADRDARPAPTSPRSAPTTSPSTPWPPTACSAASRRFQDPVAPGRARLISRGRRRRAGRSGSRWGSAARRQPTRCSPSCSSGSARRASRCRRRPSPTCGRQLAAFRRWTRPLAHWRRSLSTAVGAAEARSRPPKAFGPARAFTMIQPDLAKAVFIT